MVQFLNNNKIKLNLALIFPYDPAVPWGSANLSHISGRDLLLEEGLERNELDKHIASNFMKEQPGSKSY